MHNISLGKSAISKEIIESMYSSGFNRIEVCSKLGISTDELISIEKKFGIRRRYYATVSESFVESHRDQFQKFLNLHNKGFSFDKIAELCGCSHSQVAKIFRVFGYSFDSAYKTKKAHDAVRGKKRTYSDLCHRSMGIEANPTKMSRWETYFKDFLVANNIPFTFCKSVGKYNVDFAIGSSIAVELFGGAFHATGRAADRMHERMKFLIDNGWNVYVIWCLSKESCIFSGCFDDFIAFMNMASGNKSSVGQYRVIWSDGDFISAGSVESDYLAAVKPSAFRHNALAKYRTARN